LGVLGGLGFGVVFGGEFFFGGGVVVGDPLNLNQHPPHFFVGVGGGGPKGNWLGGNGGGVGVKNSINKQQKKPQTFLQTKTKRGSVSCVTVFFSRG